MEKLFDNNSQYNRWKTEAGLNELYYAPAAAIYKTDALLKKKIKKLFFDTFGFYPVYREHYAWAKDKRDKMNRIVEERYFIIYATIDKLPQYRQEALLEKDFPTFFHLMNYDIGNYTTKRFFIEGEEFNAEKTKGEWRCKVDGYTYSHKQLKELKKIIINLIN